MLCPNGFLVAAVLLLGSAMSQKYVTVNTKYGPVMGNVLPGSEEWLGVPFAKPPSL
jgi:hypothetical protein